MKQFLVLSAVLLIFVSGCKKQVTETPPNMEENPVFSFTGQVDNVPVSLVAGVNDYYMYSNFGQDTSGMYYFNGDLKKVNCITNCDNSITFKINDHKRSATGGTSGIDSLLPGDYYYFKDTTSPGNFIEFKPGPMPNTKPVAYQWYFGDGSTSVLENPTHSYLTPATYSVCLSMTYTNGCTNTICNDVKAESLADCMAQIEHTISGDSVFFDALTNGTSPSYYWNFADSSSSSNTSSLKNPAHVFSKPGIYKVMLETITIDNCTTRVFKNVMTGSYSIGCYSNFTYSKLYVPVPSRFSEITITFKDKNDVVYTSGTVTQPSDSYFQVISVEEYKPNENNLRTKKIHARFKCNLSNGSKVISISNGDAIIAVAYP